MFNRSNDLTYAGGVSGSGGLRKLGAVVVHDGTTAGGFALAKEETVEANRINIYDANGNLLN